MKRIYVGTLLCIILTRPMRDDEEPETHTFQQSSEFGVFEGTVTIVESVVEGENAS